jgi:arsenate reductase (thioredoxin)
MLNVLILCTANSARSILGEAILNRIGSGRVMAYSAGSHPRGQPNLNAIRLLGELGYSTETLRSKSWDEFAESGAPKMDLVITVCDAAAGESCPYWPGAPLKVHWGIPDPAGASTDGHNERAAFRLAYDRLEARMAALVALPFETMDRDEQQKALQQIAVLEGGTDLARQQDHGL